jgi:uncharacterized membrane protein
VTKNRLEAFSDGVLAIIITIMVLELHPARTPSLAGLLPLLPAFLSYLLSFIYLGIYWNNHHHLFQLVRKVNGKVLWANLHLLFWLSLLPFATGWMGASTFACEAVALYNVILMMAALAYFILTRALIGHHGPDSELARAVGRDRKGLYSLLAYVAAVPLTFAARALGLGIAVAVALVWLVPDRRMERTLDHGKFMAD